MNYLIGVDCGTDSVRSVLITDHGEEVCEAVFYYPRWMEGRYCNPNSDQFRHHPKDYLEGIEYTLKEVVSNLSDDQKKFIRAISIDTTGSTPIAVNKQGVPLSLLPEFEDSANAMFILWKDHTATQEATELTTLATTWGGIDYTQYVGGVYSSEWFWAKILHVLRTDPKIRDAAYSWVELCDWLPYMLTGAKDVHEMKRSRCAAGHKAMWHESYGGLPSEEFLVQLDPLLIGLRDRLYEQTYTSDVSAGTLSKEWMDVLGLNHDVHVAVGAFDAHMGAVGGRIESVYMVRVMGTSSCDMVLADNGSFNNRTIKGICGQVDGSIIPGYLGLEAGQSGFGDVLAWYARLLTKPTISLIEQSDVVLESAKKVLIEEISDNILSELEKQAMSSGYLPDNVMALDWFNGRRTPDANQFLMASIEGLKLGTEAYEVYIALVQAICFGSKAIVDRFISEGVDIKGIIAMGGVSKKAPYIMQTLADVLDLPVKVVSSEQACARGAAIFGAVASHVYPSVEIAVQHMASSTEKTFHPNLDHSEYYQKRYEQYQRLAVYTEKSIMSSKEL